MQSKKKWGIVLLLLILAILIHVFSGYPAFIENHYATGEYQVISKFLRISTGWIPFSIGDVIYTLVVAWLIWKLCDIIYRIFKKRISKQSLLESLRKTLVVLLSIYIVFNFFWGINYNRKGIAFQLDLTSTKYSAQELKEIDSLLLIKVNESKTALLNDHISSRSYQDFFNEAIQSYSYVAETYPFLQYQKQSVKASLWGWLGNYVGFLGYYNPFTGEAQVNTTVPYFIQPYTVCHEMAHQLGYAKEDEANFVGYLAAAASGDTLFHYSVYLDLFLTANRNLYTVDSTAAKFLRKQLNPAVKDDLKQWGEFLLQHKNPVEPVIRWMYGKYLQGNQQPKGMLSYDEVTGLLIAYHKKYGKL